MTHGWWAVFYAFRSSPHSYVGSWSGWGYCKPAEECKIFCIVDGNFLPVAIVIACCTLLILNTTPSPRITIDWRYPLLSSSARCTRNNVIVSFKRHNPDAVITMQGIGPTPQNSLEASQFAYDASIWQLRMRVQYDFIANLTFRNSVGKNDKATRSILSFEYPVSRNGEWLCFSTTLCRFLILRKESGTSTPDWSLTQLLHVSQF